MIAFFVFVVEVAVCVVAAIAAGWLIGQLVHFTLSFLHRTIKRWFNENPEMTEGAVIDVDKSKEKMQKELRSAMGILADNARKEGNTISLSELEQQVNTLKKGIDALNTLKEEDISQIIVGRDENAEVIKYDAYTNLDSYLDSYLDPELEHKMSNGSMIITI